MLNNGIRENRMNNQYAENVNT